MRKALFLLTALFLAGGALVAAGRMPAEAVAGPCGTSHDGLTAEEQQFLGLLQGWRDANLTYSQPLEVSGALNAAAAWYAQHQLEAGPFANHTDAYGRRWFNRAADCGYSAYYANGSGEGVSVLEGSNIGTVGPSQAIELLNYPGSGIKMQSPYASLPAKCVGVGVYRTPDGTGVAWVALIAQYPANQPCPGALNAGPGGTTTTSTATATPTKTSTPTATPTQTPQANYGMTVTLNMGWNLQALPAGDLEDILDTVAQCVAAVYQQSGDQWLRWAPGVPDYAQNLAMSSGGVFWIEAKQNCGTVAI